MGVEEQIMGKDCNLSEDGTSFEPDLGIWSAILL